MATGIRDKVAILGMGCTRFGERWDVGAEELMVEAFAEAVKDAGIDRKEIQAAWLGTCMDEINVGKSALSLSLTLRLPNIPVTRVENYCATGTEAFRGACYAVASGACDIALALGVEKLKDTGYGGLPNWGSDAGSLDLAMDAQLHRARSFCSTGERVRGQAQDRRCRPKACDGPCLGQEPRQRHVEPQGALAQGCLGGRDHGRAHHRPSAGAVRLLRRERWRGLRDCHHARHRPGPGQEGPCQRQGASACAQQRRRDGL